MSVIQTKVALWMDHCFGAEVAQDKMERSYRFIEECLELVQAIGMTKLQVLQMVEYTFGRPKGVVAQEVGGVVVTLAALCQAAEVDMLIAGDKEIDRISTPQLIDRLRQKQATKPQGSPLPGTPLDDLTNISGQNHEVIAGLILKVQHLEKLLNEACQTLYEVDCQEAGEDILNRLGC